MIPQRPRVNASFECESVEVRSHSGLLRFDPSIEISLDFDLHDHERALRLLDAAVESVRAQIEETK